MSPRARSCIFLFMPGGPSQIDTFDPKPRRRPGRRQAAAVREAEADAPGDRQPAGLAVQVRAARRVRHRGQRAVPPRGRLRRRPVRHPLDGRRQHQSHRRQPADEHGRAGLLPAEPGLVAGLRPGQREPEPARLRRDQPGHAAAGRVAVELELPAGRLPGDVDQGPQGPDPQPQGPARRPGPPAGEARRAASGSTSCTGGTARWTARSTRASPRSSWPSACSAQAPEAFAIDAEGPATRKLYGIDDPATEIFGKQCLLARRLVERGVRFVQVYDTATGNNSWDHHGGLRNRPAEELRGVDRPIAGLLKDLKARGLLEDTLVVWGGEFGRTPTAEGTDGREHHPFGFTMWLAGGGIKGGTGPRRHRRVRLVRRGGQGPRPRPARHDPAPDGHRPRAADVSLQRPRLSADRRAREGCARDLRVVRFAGIAMAADGGRPAR